ncbi:hypothetical protein BCR32DRAFT_288855 [Anaeromyces robustus]|uniref:Acyltransferase 3 domain-containing protein n=1 Tax=Anaeromyces robustus TaxID=1754192 RepID=A0A1Y1XQU4_9FUNG|nr:hypothetical protein BCR32DRAFT_288855 [Anaeromyces robustus]|eukprot:ORX88103.1 hypothetical protein BCR32DRAFT_288855 [Anaeromyces robustus]
MTYSYEYLSVDVDEKMINNSKNSSSLEIEEDELTQSTLNDKIDIKDEVKRKRIYWIDALRVFSNYLVILTHISLRYDESDLGSYTWYVNTFYNSSSRACVPLFIMISGILFLNPKKELSCKKMYSKYILRIFKSYIFWSFIYNAIDTNVSSYFFDRSKFKFDKKLIQDTIKNFILGGGHLWYLNFIIGLYAATPIIKKITPDRFITWYACIIFIIISQFVPTLNRILTRLYELKEFSIIQDYVDGLKFEMAGGYLAYYLLGYLLNEDYLNKIYIYITYAIGILGVILTYVFRCAYAFHINNKDEYSFLDFNFFTITMISVGIFTFFKYTLRPKINNLVTKYNFFEKALIILSDNSFGIYLIHLIINRVFNLILPLNMFEPLIWTPITAIIIHLISLTIIYYLRKIQLFREVMEVNVN